MNLSRSLTGALMLLSLAACTGQQEQIKYYVLSPGASERIVQAEEDLVLGLGPLTMPRHLDRPEVVRRLSSNQVQLQEFHHWAEPLNETILRVMGQNLETHLGLNRIEIYPWNRTAGVTHQVSFDVLVFDQAADGEVHMDVRWKISDGPTETPYLARTTRLRVVVTDQSVEAMVAGLSAALTELSREISSNIRRRGKANP